MKKTYYKNILLLFSIIMDKYWVRIRILKLNSSKAFRNIALALLVYLPFAVNATLTLPAIPSNSNLAKRFELSTEMIFRVKVGETYLPSGALIAYINGEIRGAQTASVNFPVTGINVYKILVFNDKATGDEISFKYYDIFTDKIYDITEKITFVPNQIPDYANPAILNAFCKPIDKVSGLFPEDGKSNLNTTFDLFWQPSPNTSYYNLFLWEDGASASTVPYYSNIYNTTVRLYNLKYGQLYHWKVGSVNNCSSIESPVQSFTVRQLPDLTVTDVLAPVNIESGSHFTISFKLKNIGAGNTAGTQWNDAVFISNDATFSNDDRLLSNTTNIKQLDKDSTYTQSVDVSLPIEYSGNCYFFVKTDYYNSIVELLEDNNQARTTNTTNVSLKSLPDILVKDIQAEKINVNPGDSLLISWKVENIGNVAATGGWVERISLIPVSGLKLTLEPSIEYKLPLASKTIINRSKKLRLPDILKFSGDATVEVELIPLSDLIEYQVNKANNKAVSAGNVTVNSILTLDIQATSILENIVAPVRCIVTRSGNYSADLTVGVVASVTGQITIPATVTIPANQSSVLFNLNTVNNTILEGSRDVAVIASAPAYSNSSKIITILDDEIPSLSPQLSKTTATEGETIELTVTRDLVTNKDLTVSLSTNKSSQWKFPATLVIPANVVSGKVSVNITDDNIPELKGDAVIYASSSGLTTGQVTASIVDDDIPEVSIELLADTVSESAGIYATWGVITRVKGQDNITVNLTSVPANVLFFPATISLPKGVLSQKFNIGVVDNNEVDGYRKVTISGSVFISSCNCGTTPENGGVVKADLVIADNDGPSLSVSVNPVSLPEGKLKAGNLTISRNTPTSQALAVTISHNDPTEVGMQTSATIPAGEKSVTVPINTLDDGIEDGTQMVSVQVGATSFSSGYGYVFVTDLNKPDMEITDIQLNTDTAATNDIIEITGSTLNSGFGTAPSGVKIKFYCSKDKTIDSGDKLLGEFVFPSAISQGGTTNIFTSFEVPDETGNFFVLAKINPEQAITELEYFNNESEPANLTITPEYSVTAIADNDLYMPNSTVTIHGVAINNKNQQVPNVDVDVYILSGGTRRELKAKTNILGEYTVDFIPISSESGHYSIGASFPKQNLSVEQDKFDIPGLRREPTSNIIWEMKKGQTLVGKIGIKNTSEAALNKLVVIADRLPIGCELNFDTIAILSGNQSKEFTFTLKATELTNGSDYEKINFQIKSIEGISTDFKAYYYCQALQAQLQTDPVSINTTMTKGKSRIYELFLFNNGAGESGTVNISLPNVDWMTLISPSEITNLSAGDSTKIILNLAPTADIPLNTPISGNIAVNCVNGTGVSLPYRIEAVSEETGGLKIDVIDEYTYYTEAKPHVKNAHVVVRHPFSGAIVADGFTDDNGIFEVGSLPEGAYRMNVEADKHEGFQTTLTIDPGRTYEQTVFLSFQAISYTWEVVPTEIEDSYEVQLVMKFETNVPVPVVVMEMPTEMPQLFNDETFPFMVTLTNKGLITAKDVQLTMPQNDPEYIFLTNFSKLDLFAQQAIQVPVVMKRRDALKSANATQSTGPCSDYSFTIYGWECGKDNKWAQTSHGITFSGRVCAGTGGGGGGWGGGYYGGYNGDPSRGGSWPSNYSPNNNTPTISKPTVECDKCLIDVAQAVLGCVKLHPYVALAVNVAGCGYSAMDGEITFMDVFNCVISFTPAKYARDGYKCALGIANAAKTCYEDPPFFLKNATLTKSVQISKMPPILQQSVHDLEAFLYGNSATNSIISEFMGSGDWDSKENFNDFVDQIKPFTSGLKSILPADLLLIKQNMDGTDIASDEISAFATRWNSTLEAHKNNITSPTAEYPNIVDYNVIDKYIQRIDSVKKYTFSRGFADVGDMYIKSMDGIEEQINSGRSSVCSSVTINITQKVVMTREAFEGTLTIYNGNKTTAMKDIKLNLEIKDENGVLSNDLFQIDTKALSILTGIDGTGTLGADEKGSATVLFIPEKGAAPTVPKSYSFGGSFSYLDPFTGVTVTKPLFPVTLDVNPSPDLWLHYFMQRDILGDDPLTIDKVEPIIPADFAVMVQNNGYGTAKSVRIESAQPKIVENEKGLAINFALIGSNLNGQPRQLGLTNIDFGNIAPQKTAIGQWWFTSDLLGHFISYETKLTHLDSRGNPDLSLISGATMHELIKSVRVYTGADDNINDFLVNEVQDSKELPDVIYLSNGGTLDVYEASSSSTSGSVNSGNHEIELTVVPSQVGWNYVKLSDPGNNIYKIASVTRSDGQVIPLDNVWQTFVTLPDGKEPIYENMLHLLDIFAGNTIQKYIIKYNALDQNPPEIVRFENVPTSFVTNPVTSVNVVFSKPIDPSTFNYEDMTLRVQGGVDIIDATVQVSQINQTTFKIDLTSKSAFDGFYVLNVQTSQIKDLTGTNGAVGKQANWTQFVGIPAISEFIGLPDNKIGSPIDLILLRFNVPIDKSTILPAKFTWTKDGTSVSGSVVITEMDTEGKLFQLSGLKGFMSVDGKYSLTVDLPNIKSLDGNNGMQAQSVGWEIDQKAPGIKTITPSSDGGYDAQHYTSFNVLFNEKVKGFGIGSLELWKDGQRQPLSQLNLTKKTDSEYQVTEFRLLTYYEGNYILKVKMKDITDIAGNSGTDTIRYEWTVNRTGPKAVTNLHITPDLGFSDTDDITSVKNSVVLMTVNQIGTRIKIYQTDQVNAVLLADSANVNAGALALPVSFGYSGNLTLEAHCIDQFANNTITKIPVYIDDVALIGTWKNIPQATVVSQLTSIQIEFSDRLLDDTKLKDLLTFECDGKSIGTQSLIFTKLTDKLYALSGIDQVGNASGTYNLSLDLTKLSKYTSGKQGVAETKAQWTILNTNKEPLANAGPDQIVNEGTLVTLDGSASTDPDNDALTYSWIAPSGINLSSATIVKPTFTSPNVLTSTNYTFSLVVNDSKSLSVADQVVITVKMVPKHFIPVWTGNGNDHMNLKIYSAKIDGVDLEVGDEIGIFDGTTCVGSGIVNSLITQNTTLDIVVSRSDGSGNGYTPGKTILFKIYNKKKDREFPNVVAIYSDADTSWSTDGKFAIGATAFATLTASTYSKQDILLNTGWNIISTNIIPEDLDLKNIFKPIIDSGKLKKVMDETGKTIENLGVFGGWKNYIGDLNSSKGYKVNVLSSTTLSLEGTPVQLPFDIALNAGWNIISYPSSVVHDAKALVQSLIDAGKLKKVMDETGKTIENLGVFGGWKNYIGNFIPGKGYKINVTSNCTLTIPATGTKSTLIVPDVLASTHFPKVFIGNGTDHMNIYLVNFQKSGLLIGDEIGVFDGSLCVGSATIGVEQMIAECINITASNNDELSENPNGFTPGHPIELRLYRDGQTYPMNLIKISGNEFYEKNESLLIQSNVNGLTSSQTIEDFAQFKCFPNPFLHEISIEIWNSSKTEILVEIYNMAGLRIKNLYRGNDLGNLFLTWDGTNDSGQRVAPGVYLCKVNNQSKLVIFGGGESYYPKD